MAKTIKPQDIGAALEQELAVYHEGVVERVNAVGKASIAKLKKLTKAKAPVASGSFKKNIATKEQKSPVNGVKSFIWYVKPPDHRITHLLVHGHATRTGGRTKANPFLKNALATVLPEYEENVKEAIKND
jgi:hypothetical protein